MSDKPKLLEQLRQKIRRYNYSIRTEKAYCDWCKRYILFHNKRHPADMGSEEVEKFLTYLAVKRLSDNLQMGERAYNIQLFLLISTPIYCGSKS
jgi:Phage integrase, N-terminal SAM-like domain